MERTERVKKLVKWIEDNDCKGKQTFGCLKIVGDIMTTVYKADGITVDFCYGLDCFEIFGLTDEEYESLRGDLDIR